MKQADPDGADPAEAAAAAPSGEAAAGERSCKLLDRLVGAHGERRPGQRLLAESIAEAFAAPGGRAAADAPTGIGKSFAGIAAAAATSGRTVYSTAKKTLQDQLATQDLPVAARRLGVRWAEIKGRSNYVCPAMVEETGNPLATIAVDECPGKRRCRHARAGGCPYYQALAKARAADLVIVNHALLAVDAKTGGALLGGYEQAVIDEAHAFADAVNSVFKSTLTAARIQRVGAVGQFAPTQELADKASEATETLLARFRSAAESAETEQALPSGFRIGLKDWLNALTDCVSGADDDAICPDWPEDEDHEPGDDRDLELLPDPALARAVTRLGKMRSEAAWLDADADGRVRFWEDGSSGPALVSSPYDAAAGMAAWWDDKRVAMMSATLSAAHVSRAGLPDVGVFKCEDPFRRADQSVLFVPGELGRRNNSHRAKHQAGLRLIETVGGGALWLFTSWSSLAAAEHALAGQLGSGIRLIAQKRSMSAAERHRAVDQFKAEEDAVLLGVRSFEEGIDVPGRSLRLVIWHKLPFEVPTAPVFQARCAQADAALGGSGWTQVSMPDMVTRLRQGAGRLLRSQADIGVVAVLDHRLADAKWAWRARRHLPPMIRGWDEMEDWIEDRMGAGPGDQGGPRRTGRAPGW